MVSVADKVQKKRAHPQIISSSGSTELIYDKLL